jgi:aspartyl-tRNA synthetase
MKMVIQVEGRVAPRLPGTENSKLATGEIEVLPARLTVLNRAEALPFPIDAEVSNEDLRLTYRYYDLRRPQPARNLRLRHRVAKATRDYLDSQDFVEVETPILSKSTPEGARDFLVPSHLMPGRFYALPQAPQQYKQLLMVAGVEKYFQIAKCFRDEDLRADRQPEFTQIDIEASFVRPDDIYTLTEEMLAAIFKTTRGIEIPIPFPRLTYREAVDTFGSDKPDRRFGMQVVDFTEEFRQSGFKLFRSVIEGGGVVKAINAKGFAGITIGQVDEMTGIAKTFGAKGLAFIKIENGEWKSPIVKFFSEAEKDALQTKLGVEEGRPDFLRLRQMGNRDRSARAATPARRGNPGPDESLGNTRFPLGNGLSAPPVRCRGQQVECRSSSLYPAESRRPAVARREALCRDAGRSLRRGPERSRDRRRQHPDP